MLFGVLKRTLQMSEDIISINAMWRDETGIIEMLFTYIGDYQVFSGWSSWRSIVIDILSSHEDVRQQRINSACESRRHSLSKEEIEAISASTAKGHVSGAQTFDLTWPVNQQPPWMNTNEDKGLVRPSGGAPIGHPPPAAIAKVKLESQDDLPKILESLNSASSTVSKTPDGSRDEQLVKNAEDRKPGDPGMPQLSSSTVAETSSAMESRPSELPSEGIDDNAQGQEKRFSCNFCSKSFYYFTRKKEHEKTHTGEKPFICSYCPKSFRSSTHKRDHERTHTGERPFSCAFCPKSFTQRAHMKEHERTHTGERPYACAFCDRTFIQSCQKKIHERTHMTEMRSDSGISDSCVSMINPLPAPFPSLSLEGGGLSLSHERRYRCDVCPLTFSTLGEKFVHEQVHVDKLLTTPVAPNLIIGAPHNASLTCRFCSKSFDSVEVKRGHELSHTGVKPYQCRFCGKSFRNSSHKKDHERTHTGEKPYSCSFCSKSFTQRAHRKEHERTHLNGKKNSLPFSLAPPSMAPN